MTDDSPPPNADVRMRGFTHRWTVDEALAWLDAQRAPLPSQVVPLLDAAGRVLAQDVQSDVDVPSFDRAMMDGYALLAADTRGATPHLGRSVEIIGQALPGAPFSGRIAAGTAVRVMTGAPLPEGADAVLPVELTHADAARLRVHGEVAPGKHVGRRGEDITGGTRLLSAGRRLRPQDVGVLSSIGVASVAVVRLPRVRIVVTGDELLPPGSRPRGCQITDANSPMLSALVRRDGGELLGVDHVADRRDEILAALRQPCDVLLVSGGSSTGQEDHVPTLVAEHGRLAIHGIAMRPASPTGLGRLGESLVLLLPGNPVSCLCGYDFFAGRAIRALGGRPRHWPYRSERLPLSKRLTAVPGRVDYLRVSVVDGCVEPIIGAGSSVLSSTTQADGFIIAWGDRAEYVAGDEVEVFHYD